MSGHLLSTTRDENGYPVVGIMKLVVLGYSQLMVNDRSADKWSSAVVVVSRLPSPLLHTSGKRERSAAAADASDLVGIGVCVTNASVTRSGRPQAVSNKGKVFPYSLPSVGPGADPGVQAVSPQVT